MAAASDRPNMSIIVLVTVLGLVLLLAVFLVTRILYETTDQAFIEKYRMPPKTYDTGEDQLNDYAVLDADTGTYQVPIDAAMAATATALEAGENPLPMPPSESPSPQTRPARE